MQAIKAVYDGYAFTPTQPIPVQGHYEVVITFIEPIFDKRDRKTIPQKRRLGFLKDKVPPLPDSFLIHCLRRIYKHGGCKIFA